MDSFTIIWLCVLLCVASFYAGRGSVQWPSEEEMIKRLKAKRFAIKMHQEADAEVEEILKR